MITHLKGTVYDENGQTVPFANVYISDHKGNRITMDAHVKSLSNGSYILPVSSNGIPFGTHLTVKSSGSPFYIEKISFEGEGQKTHDIKIKLKEYTQNDVVIEVNRLKYLCEQHGGVYDETIKTCTLPDKQTFWKKLKPWQKIGVVAASIVAVFGLGLLLTNDKNK